MQTASMIWVNRECVYYNCKFVQYMNVPLLRNLGRGTSRRVSAPQLAEKYRKGKEREKEGGKERKEKKTCNGLNKLAAPRSHYGLIWLLPLTTQEAYCRQCEFP